MASARTENFLLASNGQGIEVRFVYPYLAKKRDKDWQNKPLPPDKQDYEVMILIPKRPDDSVQRPYVGPKDLVPKAWEAWCQLPGVNGQWSASARWPILDCDVINPATGGGRPETEPYAQENVWARGCWRINASSKFPVRVVGPDNVDIAKNVYEDFVGFKGGDFGLASIHCFAYQTGSGGVSFGIEGVKKLRDGDPIGGGQRSPEQMFGGSAPMASAPPIPGGYAPSPAYGGTPGPVVTPQAPHFASGMTTAAAPQPIWNGATWVMPPAGGPQPGFPPSLSVGAPPPLAPPAYGQGAPTAPPAGPSFATQYPSNAPPAPQMGMPPVPPPAFGTR